MGIALWLLPIAAVLLVGWMWLGGGNERLLRRAIREQDVTALVEALQRGRRDGQPDAFHHVIHQLWNAYERPLAISVIRTLVEQHPDSRIAQYWMDQVRSVEPALAREQLGQSFYEMHFQPHVAATCGKVG